MKDNLKKGGGQGTTQDVFAACAELMIGLSEPARKKRGPWETKQCGGNEPLHGCDALRCVGRKGGGYFVLFSSFGHGKTPVTNAERGRFHIKIFTIYEPSSRKLT